MLNIGDELIGNKNNPYLFTCEGKRVVVLSVREKEQNIILANWFSEEKNDLLVVLGEELKGQSIAIVREMVICYMEYIERRNTGEFFPKDFSFKPKQPTIYQVSSKYFTFNKYRNQTRPLLPLRSRLTEQRKGIREEEEEWYSQFGLKEFHL